MKQAVVLIHGIGEQKPMATLRSFVEAILPSNMDGREKYWSKPDPMSELFELRRLQATGRTKTHFYEYYWAYHVEGTKRWHLARWLWELLLRKWCNVPAALRGIWLMTWIFALMLAMLGGLGGLAYLQNGNNLLSDYGSFGILFLLLAGMMEGFLVYHVGDAVRYLSPHPQNIALRQKIRAEGVRLLRQLHDSRDYDRIIIVGHSLGSVIGYDLITHLWIEHNRVYDFKTNAPAINKILEEHGTPQPLIGNSLYQAGESLLSDPTPEALQRFQDAQFEGWKEQRKWGNSWRISDFVTLGSPLAHAMLLLACDRDEFKARVRQRELPVCPPVREEKSYAYQSAETYPVGDGRLFTPRILHHAAPFAVTRWTNLYFPAYLGLFGDNIGGPLKKVFGPGVQDIAVTLKSWRRYTPAAHTAYWKLEPPPAANKHDHETRAYAVDALRDVLELDRIRKYRVNGQVKI